MHDHIEIWMKINHSNLFKKKNERKNIFSIEKEIFMFLMFQKHAYEFFSERIQV